MSNPIPTLTFDDVSRRMVPAAAAYVANHYGRYLVTFEDCKQEMYVWLYGDGKAWVEKRLAKSPQQIGRIRWKLRSVAKRYAEKMKAEKVGYDPDDIHWYTSTQIVALMPLVLDETFAGTGVPDYEDDSSRTEGPRVKKNPAELGDLQAMVLDIRRALDALPEWVYLVVMMQQPGDELYDQAIGAILQQLGGPRDCVGSRKVMSNAEAQARVGEV